MKYFTVAFLICISCNPFSDEHFPDRYEVAIDDHFFKGKAVLKKLSNTDGFKVLLIGASGETTDQVIFNYKPYQFDAADINLDGKGDILVGLIKTTEFDPVERKRLFILRIDEGQLRPLWLGSKVCQELVNFKSAAQGTVLTWEKTKKGNYAIGQYAWQGFGLTLINYTHNEISYNDASEIFRN